MSESYALNGDRRRMRKDVQRRIDKCAFLPDGSLHLVQVPIVDRLGAKPSRVLVQNFSRSQIEIVKNVLISGVSYENSDMDATEFSLTPRVEESPGRHGNGVSKEYRRLELFQKQGGVKGTLEDPDKARGILCPGARYIDPESGEETHHACVCKEGTLHAWNFVELDRIVPGCKMPDGYTSMAKGSFGYDEYNTQLICHVCHAVKHLRVRRPDDLHLYRSAVGLGVVPADWLRRSPSVRDMLKAHGKQHALAV